MKKILIIGAALTAALSISAQKNVVQEVERNLKSSSPNPAQALKDIQPALTNPETATDAQTWIIAGNAGFDVFQDAYIQLTMGQPVADDKKVAAADAMLNAFNYYITALPLDTVRNDKGKVKTKHSKNIVKKIKEKYGQLPDGAALAWEAQDYAKAYDLFEMLLTLPKNPVLGENAPEALPDTVQGKMIWNQVIAKLLLNQPAEALVKIRQMEPLGYIPDDFYEYAVGAAQSSGNEAAALEFAQKGLDKYGPKNTTFIAAIINDKLNKKEYAEAYRLTNEALSAVDPSDGPLRAQLYDILGTIAENDDKIDEAEKHFRSSVEADPQYAKGWYDLGRIVHNRAISVDNTIETEQQRVEKVYPLEREAAGYFEKSFGLDDQQSNIPGVLYRIYYMLGDNAKASYWQNQ